MNDGKICISICARTADELSAQIKRAEPLADVIELRFDCLEPNSLLKTLSELPRSSKAYLITFRPAGHGGHREIDDLERSNFWIGATDWLNEHGYYFDQEFNWSSDNLPTKQKIASVHDFDRPTTNLNPLYSIFKEIPAHVLKIAQAVDTVVEGLHVWKFLNRFKSEGHEFIPIAMGEAGKWTRILGLAHGAFMTYASLESGSETAPGQISAEDLIDIFRVKELDKHTEVFGIVAGDTSYSISPWMHNAAFKVAGMNRVFVPLQTDDLDEFIRRMVKPETREVELNFRGFSVTNPHKQTIIRHLDKIDETAAKIGAVNTVKIDGEKLIGFNTDAPGFIAPLKKHHADLNGASVAVVGAGGAARAVIYALQQEGANVTLHARDVKKASTLAEEVGVPVYELNTNLRPLTADILVNTTPLGTKGENQEMSIAKAEQLNGVKLVYDLIYNPIDTLLIREAIKAGVPTIGGIEMLIEQGAEQFRIWTGVDAPVDAMTTSVRKKLNL